MPRFQLRISYLYSLLLSSHPVSLQIHLKPPSFFFPLLPSSLPSVQASLRASSSGTIESVHGGYLGVLTPAQIVHLEPSLMLALASLTYPVVHPFPPDQLPPQLSVYYFPAHDSSKTPCDLQERFLSSLCPLSISDLVSHFLCSGHIYPLPETVIPFSSQALPSTHLPTSFLVPTSLRVLLDSFLINWLEPQSFLTFEYFLQCAFLHRAYHPRVKSDMTCEMPQ